MANQIKENSCEPNEFANRFFFPREYFPENKLCPKEIKLTWLPLEPRVNCRLVAPSSQIQSTGPQSTVKADWPSQQSSPQSTG